MKKVSSFILLFAFLTACAPGPAYQDDFNNPDSGWSVEAFETGENSYEDGGYRMYLSAADWFSWVVNPTAVVYSDVRVEVDAQKIGGLDANEYGAVCRVDFDAGSFYAGAVTSQGEFAIYKNIEESGLELIDMAALGFSQAVKQGGENNHIRFDCVGNTLTLYANDTQLVQVTDETLPSGEVGLYSGTFDPGGTEILFDNFAVYRQ
ncbi:MAG TPA: hypothetical protein VI703_01670 [Anaerolineales bacterium]|nr:hypothetical protein [Anaerolineales bacterium]